MNWSIEKDFVATHVEPNNISSQDMAVIKQMAMGCYNDNNIVKSISIHASHLIYLKHNGNIVAFSGVAQNSEAIELYFSCGNGPDYMKMFFKHVIHQYDKTKKLCIILTQRTVNDAPFYASLGFVKPEYSTTKPGKLESKAGIELDALCVHLTYSEKSSKKTRKEASEYAVKLLKLLNSNMKQWSITPNNLASLINVSQLTAENIDYFSDKLVSEGVILDKTDAITTIKKSTAIIMLLNLNGDPLAFCTVEITPKAIQITCMCKISVGGSLYAGVLLDHIIKYNKDGVISALVDSRQEVDFYADSGFVSDDLVMQTVSGNKLVFPKLKVVYTQIPLTTKDIDDAKKLGYNLIHINFTENHWTIKKGYRAYALNPSAINDRDINALAQQMTECYDLSVSDAKKEIMSCNFVAWLSSTSASKLTFCLINREIDSTKIPKPITPPKIAPLSPTANLSPDSDPYTEYRSKIIVPPTGWNTEISRICTPQIHRKKGNASILLEHIIDRAKDSAIWLNIHSDKAINLCKLGFVSPVIVNANIKGERVSPSMVRLFYDEKSDEERRVQAEIASRNFLDLIKDSRGRINKIEIDRNSLKTVYEKLIYADTEWGGRVEYNLTNKKLVIRDLVKGDKTTVHIPCHSTNMRFHTHPKPAYDAVSFGVAPMSTADCKAAIYCKDAIHIVFAIEAIYVIEINTKVYEFLTHADVYQRAEHDAFCDSIFSVIDSLGNSAYGLSMSLKQYVDILVKSNNGDVLATVDDDQRFLSACTKWIDKITQLYGGITVGKVINNDNTGLLKAYSKLKSIPKNTSVFDIHKTINPYGLYRKNKPVYIQHRQF